jgi:uncharacterized protein YihD (DUF1040 family)
MIILNSALYYNNEICPNCEKIDNFFNDNNFIAGFIAFIFWNGLFHMIGRKNFQIQIDLISQLERKIESTSEFKMILSNLKDSILILSKPKTGSSKDSVIDNIDSAEI